jgi:hypothetical protein
MRSIRSTSPESARNAPRDSFTGDDASRGRRGQHTHPDPSAGTETALAGAARSGRDVAGAWLACSAASIGPPLNFDGCKAQSKGRSVTCHVLGCGVKWGSSTPDTRCGPDDDVISAPIAGGRVMG